MQKHAATSELHLVPPETDGEDEPYPSAAYPDSEPEAAYPNSAYPDSEAYPEAYPDSAYPDSAYPADTALAAEEEINSLTEFLTRVTKGNRGSAAHAQQPDPTTSRRRRHTK